MLTDWVRHVATTWEIDLETDPELVDLVLDLARDAAHSIARPAAPLTTFLVGYAAAQRGGSAEQVRAYARLAAELANDWAGADRPGEEQPGEERPGEEAAQREDPLP